MLLMHRFPKTFWDCMGWRPLREVSNLFGTGINCHFAKGERVEGRSGGNGDDDNDDSSLALHCSTSEEFWNEEI